MIAFRKILVPTDFSENSKKALPVAVAMAAMHGGEIILLHVVQELGSGYGQTKAPAQFAELQREIVQEAEKDIREMERESLGHPVSSRTIVVEGAPYLEILRIAEEEAADVVVLATHGHTGLKQFVLGSTAERVVRHARCPVMTVKE